MFIYDKRGKIFRLSLLVKPVVESEVFCYAYDDLSEIRVKRIEDIVFFNRDYC